MPIKTPANFHFSLSLTNSFYQKYPCMDIKSSQSNFTIISPFEVKIADFFSLCLRFSHFSLNRWTQRQWTMAIWKVHCRPTSPTKWRVETTTLTAMLTLEFTKRCWRMKFAHSHTETACITIDICSRERWVSTWCQAGKLILITYRQLFRSSWTWAVGLASSPCSPPKQEQLVSSPSNAQRLPTTHRRSSKTIILITS